MKYGIEPGPRRPALDERDADGFGLRGDQLGPGRVEPHAPRCLVVEVHEAGDLGTVPSRAIRREGAVLPARPHHDATHQGTGRTTPRPSCLATARPGPHTSPMSSALSTFSGGPSQIIPPSTSTASRMAIEAARLRS